MSRVVLEQRDLPHFSGSGTALVIHEARPRRLTVDKRLVNNALALAQVKGFRAAWPNLVGAQWTGLAAALREALAEPPRPAVVGHRSTARFYPGHEAREFFADPTHLRDLKRFVEFVEKPGLITTTEVG